MTNQNESLPVTDDVPVSNGQTEQDLLDAVMRNTDFLSPEESLPVEEIPEVDPVESEEDPESEEVVSEEVEEEVEVEEEEADSEDDSSIQPDVFSTEDIDLDAKLAVKIDGKEAEVSFGDLIKGYSTEQSLSKKGRELGEARKALDAERAEKLGELESMSTASAAILHSQETDLAEKYKSLESQIDKAREEGDTYTLGDLKDKKEVIQKEYWTARNKRESLMAEVKKQKEVQANKEWQEQIEHFQTEIPNLIPGFDEKTAESIREFALSNGIKAETLNTITDPAIVKFVNDYRLLSQGVSGGKAKRKAAPAKKVVPTKKATPASTKAKKNENMVKARAFKENASDDDHMAFLRQHASKSLNF